MWRRKCQETSLPGHDNDANGSDLTNLQEQHAATLQRKTKIGTLPSGALCSTDPGPVLPSKEQALFPSALTRLPFMSHCPTYAPRITQNIEGITAATKKLMPLHKAQSDFFGAVTKELTLTTTAWRGSLTVWSSCAARKRYYCRIHLPLLAPGSTGRLSGERNELVFTSSPLPAAALWTRQALSFLICKKSE